MHLKELGEHVAFTCYSLDGLWDSTGWAGWVYNPSLRTLQVQLPPITGSDVLDWQAFLNGLGAGIAVEWSHSEP